MRDAVGDWTDGEEEPAGKELEETEAMDVFVGAGWTVAKGEVEKAIADDEDDERLEGAEKRQQFYRRQWQKWEQGARGFSRFAKKEHLRAYLRKLEEERRALWKAKVIERAAHTPGPAALEGVLRSGRFRVTGSVYLDPLKPPPRP